MNTVAPEIATHRRVAPARWRFFVAGAVLLPAVAVLALLAYGFRTDSRYIPSPLIGKPAPLFTLTLFDGSVMRLANLRGRVVFVNFWASWCAPCREEAPALEAASRTYRPRDVVFVGINIQDKEPDARAFMDQFGITYPNGIDHGTKIAVDYGVYGIPETFIVDRIGRIAYKQIGAMTPTTIAAVLDETLAGRPVAVEDRGEFRPVQ